MELQRRLFFYAGGSWFSSLVKSFYTPPVLFGDRVISYDLCHQWLVCVSLDTGKVLWQRHLPLGSVFRPPVLRPFQVLTQYPPLFLLGEGVLFILADRLYAISLSDGKIYWMRRLSTSPSSWAYYTSAVYLKRRIYVGFQNGYVRGFDKYGREVVRRRLPSLVFLYQFADSLAGISSRKLYLWKGKDLETLEPTATYTFQKKSSFFVRRVALSRLINGSGQYIYLTALGWLQVFRYRGAKKLELLWEDQVVKKRYLEFQKRRRPSYHRYTPYSLRYFIGRFSHGPYFHKGYVLMVSQSGYLYVYRSMQDVEREYLQAVRREGDTKKVLELVRLYLQARQFPKAFHYLKELLRHLSKEDPLYPKVFSLMGEAYFQEGRDLLSSKKLLEAEKSFQNALAYGRDKSTVKLYLFWTREKIFLYRYFGAWLLYGKPRLTASLKNAFLQVIQGYLSLLEKPSFQWIEERGETDSHTFIRRRLLSLLKLPFLWKVYQN